ncbi:lytic transglycosylase domain-containing protein [Streptantibioticus rubrisoli]|uniref:Lytic transglycosylase domain-containing protein n=1 Tax=Streptantibioticus rubrisoli TaxID=1387313 RepID=A0ABT1PL95_9ACTN|nr:lytic transglycosylase domain-containing protein [Streptantibioticus rubrisoli]MCQ4046129.1 lytic transglycosylase domain-containing protein [Streptantibioticus rubrisoli]
MSVPFGRRIRKGAAGTAIAALAMAALTASQAPGVALGVAHGSTVAPPPGPPIDGGKPYITNLPPLNSPVRPGGSGQPGTGPGTGVGAGGAGIPATVLAAYQRAEAALRSSSPGCQLRWQLLAAIGEVESGQADGGNVDANGTTRTPILGPVLDGTGGNANIAASGTSYYDGGLAYARAVGPMQFIPSTWAQWGADGNGDGIKDPNNIYDASLAAAGYLCAAGGDLADPNGLDRAILGYNHSQDYLNTVKDWYQYYLNGTHEVPDGSGGGSATGAGGGRVPSAQPSPSASPSGGGRPGGGPSAPPSHSPLPTVSASGSIGPGPSGSPSPHPSGSGSPSPSPSGGCPSGSPSPSPSPSGSASASPSPSPSPSPSGSASASPSPSPSPSGGLCPTPKPSGDASPSPSPSAAPSQSAH